MNVESVYVVLTLLTGQFRIVNERGEPILVPRSLFDVLDDWVPNDWVCESDEAEGWYWHGPPQFAVRGFFERWHDGWIYERKVFADVYERLWNHYKARLGNQDMVLER